MLRRAATAIRPPIRIAIVIHLLRPLGLTERNCMGTTPEARRASYFFSASTSFFFHTVIAHLPQ
jgi:hypothetical protein